MDRLSHGSDLSLAPTIGPIVQATGSILTALPRVASAGFDAVQLDAAVTGIRPRDLDHRARKDLTASLSRRSLRLAGIDLFVPRRHYLEPQHQDRAMQATLAAIELAADLGRVPLSIALPVEQIDPTLSESLVQCTDTHGVPLAVHAEDQLDALTPWLDGLDQPTTGAAVDAAALLAGGHDAAQVVHSLAAHLRVGRLSDQTTLGAEAGAVRCAAGSGELDLTTYRISLDLAPHRIGPVVLDLRGLSQPAAAAVQAGHAWENTL